MTDKLKKIMNNMYRLLGHRNVKLTKSRKQWKLLTKAIK